MRNFMEIITDEVAAWDGVTDASHRFGGREFNLGKVEIGHIHRNGMVDILYTKRIREQLVLEGKAELHHLLPETGWITFYIREDADIDHAIWLFKLSYLQKAVKQATSNDKEKVAAFVYELEEMGVSEDIKSMLRV